jgi:hypothetical protein
MAMLKMMMMISPHHLKAMVVKVKAKVKAKVENKGKKNNIKSKNDYAVLNKNDVLLIKFS